MEIVKQGSLYRSDYVTWVLQQPWLTENRKKLLLALLLGTTSVVLSKFVPSVMKLVSFSGDDKLPIGLPNTSNFCYLNALLQAMASNKVTVDGLRQSALSNRNQMLCYLVAVLEGLRCSLGYLKEHSLLETVYLAHRLLIRELRLSGKWIIADQQDVHELYSFFLDLADNTETQKPKSTFTNLLALPTTGATVTTTTWTYTPPGLALTLPNHRQETSTNPSNPLRYLIASQIFCKKCSYHSEIKAVPESCLILFPEKSKKLNTKRWSSKRRETYRSNLEGLLREEYARPEVLSGVHCPQCQVRAFWVPENLINDPSPVVMDQRSLRNLNQSLCSNTCCSRRWLAPLPGPLQPPLVVYIQRAVWIPITDIIPSSLDFVNNFAEGGMMVKFTDEVAFPEKLDMSSFLVTGATADCLARQLKMPEKCPRMRLEYALRAVVVHRGRTLAAGHYVTYRFWEGEWLLISDHFVGRVPFSAVQACQAYMLFYEAVESTTPSSNSGAQEESSVAQRIDQLMAMTCGIDEVS